jgi:hypothetical protein
MPGSFEDGFQLLDLGLGGAQAGALRQAQVHQQLEPRGVGEELLLHETEAHQRRHEDRQRGADHHQRRATQASTRARKRL